MILTFSKIILELWKLKPNPTKTEVAWFHLNNRLANIYFDNVNTKRNELPQYLEITLVQSLTFSSLKTNFGKQQPK